MATLRLVPQNDKSPFVGCQGIGKTRSQQEAEAPTTPTRGPLLWPLAQAVGMNQIHFCVFMITTLGLGFITPPFGLNLFVMSGLTRTPVSAIATRALPFALVMVGVSALIGFVPQISLFLLNP